MWDGFNKRQFPRIHVGCEVVIHPSGKRKAFRTKTENVGMGGICVLLNERIERFDRCNLGLDLADGEPPIQFSGRSVWIIPCRDVKSSKMSFDTGIEFLEVDEQNRKRLEAFLCNRSGE